MSRKSLKLREEMNIGKAGGRVHVNLVGTTYFSLSVDSMTRVWDRTFEMGLRTHLSILGSPDQTHRTSGSTTLSLAAHHEEIWKCLEAEEHGR